MIFGIKVTKSNSVPSSLFLLYVPELLDIAKKQQPPLCLRYTEGAASLGISFGVRRNHVQEVQLRLCPPVTVLYQNLCAKSWEFDEAFVNSSQRPPGHSGAFMLSTMLIALTWRRMIKHIASANTIVSTTLYR